MPACPAPHVIQPFKPTCSLLERGRYGVIPVFCTDYQSDTKSQQSMAYCVAFTSGFDSV